MASGLMIQEVYGGGGLQNAAGSTYNADYVVLYNAGPDAIDLAGYAIQFTKGPSTTDPWSVGALSGTIQGYSYFFVRLDDVGTIGASIPAGVTIDAVINWDPDPVSQSNNLPNGIGANNGRLALTSTTVALTGDVSSGPAILDMVGYGTSAATFETAAAAAPSNTKSIVRNATGGWDTDSNLADFASLTVGTPHSSASGTDSTGAPVIGGGTTAAFSVTENTTAVATVTATDTANSAFTYQIVTGGNNGADGALFAVDSAGNLTFVAAPDFETPEQTGATDNEYHVTVRVTDNGGSSSDQDITVTVTGANDAPTAIGLSPGTLAENNAGTVLVGLLTATDQDTAPGSAAPFTFELVAGAGDTDNALFSVGGVTGDELTFTGTADYESKTSYSIRLKVTDAGGGAFETVKTVNVIDDTLEFLLTAQSDTNAAANSVDENATGAIVGITVQSSDADGSDTVSYGLVTDLTGATAYVGPFAIDATTGVVSLVSGLDFETVGPTQTIFVRAASTDGRSNVASYSVTVNNTAEAAPTDITLVSSTVAELTSNGSVVGQLGAIDDGSTFTFELVGDGAGGRFAISGNNLVVANGLLLDFEQVTSHDVTIRVTDSDNLTFDKTLTINVSDVSPEVATGDAGANTFFGGAGNDVFDGGGGSDTMRGGAGNDLYVTDGGDTITDTAGIDTIRSSVSFVLANDFENLVLIGTSGGSGTGNAAANRLDGSLNTGSNVLRGLGGNDTYILAAGDTVVEAGGAGTDTVASGVRSLNLASFANVENASATGAAHLALTGNGAVNALTGNAGNNTLNGGFGNDILRGGSGKDTFVFNSALSATANRDVIGDFSRVDDTIKLENAIFKTVGATGALNTAAFWASSTGAAHDATDRIIYNTATGVLTYDADGSGASKAIAFALLATKPTILASDFIVI